MSEAPDPEQGPYAAAAGLYWQAGWRGVLPLPPHQKGPVPVGYTGRDGGWPSYPDVYAWTEERPSANIALRLPPNVIGVDVDHYGDKHGGDTLATLEAEHGPLPPTWRVTSRDDGISGIRLYRVPEGLRWPGIFGPSIESIRMEHRYAVVWPSIHPEGGTYRWIDPDGITRLGVVPDVDCLPELPETWVRHFTKMETATDQPTIHLGDAGVTQWITERGGGIPCKHMATAMNAGVAAVLQALATGGARHDAALTATNRICWLMGEGHLGGHAALTEVAKAFAHVTANDRGRDAAGEWGRMVDGATGMAAAHYPRASTDPCLDPFRNIRTLVGETWQPPTPTSTTSPGSATASNTAGLPSIVSPTPSSTSQAPSTSNFSDGIIPPSQPSPSPASTASLGSPSLATDPYAAVRARFQTGGSFVLDIPEHVPAIWGKADDVLWADGEALTVCGPPGVGKTTLVGQVVKALLIGGDVLGLPVQRTEGRVLYFAMDRPRQIARALRRMLGGIPREVLDDHLIIWPGPPIADIAAFPETLVGVAQMVDAQIVVLDSLKDAAVGLSKDEVGAGYNRARQMVIADGRNVLELHHMIKKGEGGTKPTSLADMYGSVWIGAGAGSVILLYGAAGDPVVEFRQLKTPADEVGPFQVIHDHTAGVTTIFHGADLIALARAAGPVGITPKGAACSVEETDKPTASQIEKARRRLEKLVRAGNLSRREGSRGGSDDRNPTTYFWLADDPVAAQTAGLIPVDNSPSEHSESNHETNHAPLSGSNQSRTPEAITLPLDSCSETNHEPNHGNHGGSNHARTPSFRRGGASAGESPRRLVKAIVAGQHGYRDADTGEFFPEDDPRLGSDPDKRRGDE